MKEYNIIEVEDKINSYSLSKSPKVLEDLGGILLQSNNPRVTNLICLAFMDYADPITLPFIIELIRNRHKYRHIATAVYACEVFDCTPYFKLFFDLVTEESDLVSMHAIDVIGRMSFSRINYNITSYVMKLNQLIKLCEDSKRVSYLKKLLHFLRKRQHFEIKVNRK